MENVPVTTKEKIEDLKKRDEAARLGGGVKRIESQHAKGKMTARERIEALLDANTFEEFDRFVVHRCTDFGMDKVQNTRRRGGHRLRPGQRPPGVRLQSGFHRVRRFALGPLWRERSARSWTWR